MNLTILFFGATSDIAGERRITLDAPDEVSIAEVIKQLLEMFPDLGKLKLLAALNEEYVPADTISKDGDTIAIFTPVSGG
jgi:molybdopterin converting factor small subunit